MTVLVSNPQHASAERFNREASRARRQKFLHTIIGRSAGLLEIRHAVQGRQVAQVIRGGLQHVAVDQIQGSEGRSMDFDNRFRPLKQGSLERWCSIAMAHIEGKQLPAVDLIQIGDAYFVRDGHHRVSVAKTAGQVYIDAKVVAWAMAEQTASPYENQHRTSTHKKRGIVINAREIYGKVVAAFQNFFGRPRNPGQPLLQGGKG